MTVQWFPGHMTRARRQIEDKLKLIDAAIELLDARVPLSSRNPMIGEILKNKPRLVLLNKSDLADESATKAWMQALKDEQIEVLSIDASTGTGIQQILPSCKKLLQDKIEAQIRKGMRPRAIRALIVGIPNVGKSTLINRLAGRSIAATGDRPGVTKGQQWIKVGKELELLDTPGILWPKFEDQMVGLRLAAIGSVREEILHLDDIGFFAVKFFASEYPERLRERYGLEELPSDMEDPQQVVEIMEAIGRRRGCVVSGGHIDLEKASGVILRDLRSGKLGRITLETP